MISVQLVNNNAQIAISILIIYLVNSSEWRHINSLSSDSSSTSNTCGVLTWSRVDDGVDQDLEWVLTSQEMDDLETVLNNSDSQQLLAVVSSVHHQAVDQTLNNWALGLAESLGSVSKEVIINLIQIKNKSQVFNRLNKLM